MDGLSESEDGTVVSFEHASVVRYRPRHAALAGLLLTNALLGLLTLGVYRFWGRTRVRRHIWRQIRILDEPLEYTGTAKELLLGFLIVLAVIIPFAAANVAIEIYLSGTAENPVFDPGLTAYQVLVFVLALWLLQFAIFRARRYRLSRTVWRGLRFRQTGTARRYASIALAWQAATFGTLGLARPWAAVALESYRMNNTRFGSLAFAFKGRGSALLGRWLLALLLALPTLGASLAWYRAAEIRYLTGHTRMDGFRFESALAGRTMLGLVALYVLCLAALLLLALAVLFGLGFASLAAGLPEDAFALFESLFAQIGAVLPIAIALFFVLASGILKTLILTSGYLQAFCSTLSVTGSVDLAEVAQAADRGPRTGEGLADVFDAGGL